MRDQLLAHSNFASLIFYASGAIFAAVVLIIAADQIRQMLPPNLQKKLEGRLGKWNSATRMRWYSSGLVFFSGAMASVMVDAASHLSAIEAEASKQKMAIENISSTVALASSSLTDLRREIDRLLHSSEIDRLKLLPSRLDQASRDIFGTRISMMIEGLSNALSGGEFELDSLAFRNLWIDTLDRCPGRTFLATSLPTMAYFWEEPEVQRAMGRFSAAGGKMRRIFLLQDKLEKNSEAWEVLSMHHRLGVDVWYILSHSVEERFRQGFFLVDSEAYFSWRVDVDSTTGKILLAFGTSNREKCQGKVSDWNRMIARSVKFEPS